MNMMLKRVCASLLLMGVAGAYAAPAYCRGPFDGSRWQKSSDRDDYEREQRRQAREAREVRQADRNAAAQENGQRRSGKLSPEERANLRRQINQAGQDIYHRN
jgi:hypothetical protein